MGYNLFLDDNFYPLDISNRTDNEKDRIRYRKYNWIVVRNYDDFVFLIKEKGLPDIVSFDHDLAPEHYDCSDIIDYDSFEKRTGYHAAEWLLEYCSCRRLNVPILLIHSQNKVGKKNIENLIY
jgi:hypothetical protein